MIDTEFLEELERFQLALKKNSSEMGEGNQKSLDTGQGMIFKDHKEYIPGDDIRKIDWKAYARTKNYYVKRFEEEKRITIHILVDRSSSMDYGDNNKYEYASKLGLGLAKMSLNTNDRFNFSVFSETLTNISTGRRNSNLTEIVDILNNIQKTPESKLESCITQYNNRIENKSLVIVISDFLVDEEQIKQSLESLKNTDVIFANVFDASEVHPNFNGDKILKDPESSSKIRTYLSRNTKTRYQEKLQNHTDFIQESCQKTGADYVQLTTDQDVFDSLLEIWQHMQK